ncbi:MAG: hypothetical protein AAF766_24565, partial [Cyanobacteria bacterium P01_D01_bin.14]
PVMPLSLSKLSNCLSVSRCENFSVGNSILRYFKKRMIECLGYYNAIEHLIIRFLKYLSIELPTEKFSHRDTLKQFDSLLKDRGITGYQETVVVITNLMAFRHVATKIYGFLIDADKLNTVVEDINTHHSTIEKIFHNLLETF